LICQAGITVKAYCCQAQESNNDDTVAIDYSTICNSASRISITGVPLAIFCTITTIVIFLLPGVSSSAASVIYREVL